MKRNLFITILILILATTLQPIQSQASTNVDPTTLMGSSIPYVYQVKSADTSISWKIYSKKAKTKPIYFSKGDTLRVSATISSSSSVCIGIIEPLASDNAESIYHTTEITQYGYFTYTIPYSGTYEIYCKNLSSNTINIVINWTTQ